MITIEEIKHMTAEEVNHWILRPDTTEQPEINEHWETNWKTIGSPYGITNYEQSPNQYLRDASGRYIFASDTATFPALTHRMDTSVYNFIWSEPTLSVLTNQCSSCEKMISNEGLCAECSAKVASCYD